MWLLDPQKESVSTMGVVPLPYVPNVHIKSLKHLLRICFVLTRLKILLNHQTSELTIMSGLRVRRSLLEIQNKYDTGEDKTLLENIIRAFRGVQLKKPNYDLPPEKDLSFFRIAGFHGEPFEGVGKYDASWWGGYCHHNDVLFPVWHRAYLFHLENALRQVEGCEDVTLPFWDECFTVLNDPDEKPLPRILTTPTFTLDGKEVRNPLYSYKLQHALGEVVADANHRYSKHRGYETVRYPLSGLVGTEDDDEASEIHNAKYQNLQTRTDYLNNNVRAWLDGTVVIDKKQDVPKPRYPETYSVLSRYQACLRAPTYTLFSNKTSWKAHLSKGIGFHQKYTDFVALEDPHNAIHLAVGGFYQRGIYNADPIRGANGDMGDNETAGFDPIFFLHHAWVDYVFWLWQRLHNSTAQGSLTIDPEDPGARSIEGSVGTAPNTPLDMNTILAPFKDPKYDPDKHPEGPDNPWDPWQTLDKLTDIEKQLGYTYGPGSLHPLLENSASFTDPSPTNLVALKATEPVDRSTYAGSFVIRTFAKTPNRAEPVEIGRDAVLSRWNIKGCKNCMGRLTASGITPITKELEQALLMGEEEGAKIEYKAHVERRVFGKQDQQPHLVLSDHEINVIDL